MEILAQELRDEIDCICGVYHSFKEGDVLKKTLLLAERIKEFCSVFLQGNIFGMEEEEYQGFSKYVIEILEDYMEALEQQDIVLMLDTLDYGLRELLNIYAEDGEAEEIGNE